jgi:hypothetical protein
MSHAPAWLAVSLIAVPAACGQQTVEQSPAASPSGSNGTATSTLSPAFRATSVSVNETRGSNAVEVALPQVTGGSEAVRERFNTGMRTALDDLVGRSADTTIRDGLLAGDERSRVTTIGPRVVGGVAIFNWYGQGAAHPNNSVATIVIDVGTAQPIMLGDIWIEPRAAAGRLATLVPQIDNQVDPLTHAALETFTNWVPAPAGFHVYVPVAHALGDYLPVTVPWNKIADLMKPEMRMTLIG